MGHVCFEWAKEGNSSIIRLQILDSYRGYVVDVSTN